MYVYIYTCICIYIYIGTDGLIDVRKKTSKDHVRTKNQVFSRFFLFYHTFMYKKFRTSDKLQGEKLEDHPVECF